jgi:hypothetical protein
MRLKLVMAFAVEAFGGRVTYYAVHSLDLFVGSR